MKYCAALLLALLVSGPGFAKGCYEEAEQEAEQLVRLHSELMVITLSCRVAADGTPLAKGYQEFTTGNLERIKGAEAQLMRWHYQHGGGDGGAKLDKIRTEFHNEYSYRLAQLSPSKFCTDYRGVVQDSAGLKGAPLTDTLKKMKTGYHGRVPACPVRQAAK